MTALTRTTTKKGQLISKKKLERGNEGWAEFLAWIMMMSVPMITI